MRPRRLNIDDRVWWTRQGSGYCGFRGPPVPANTMRSVVSDVVRLEENPKRIDRYTYKPPPPRNSQSDVLYDHGKSYETEIFLPGCFWPPSTVTSVSAAARALCTQSGVIPRHHSFSRDDDCIFSNIYSAPAKNFIASKRLLSLLPFEKRQCVNTNCTRVLKRSSRLPSTRVRERSARLLPYNQRRPTSDDCTAVLNSEQLVVLRRNFAAY